MLPLPRLCLLAVRSHANALRYALAARVCLQRAWERETWPNTNKFSYRGERYPIERAELQRNIGRRLAEFLEMHWQYVGSKKIFIELRDRCEGYTRTPMTTLEIVRVLISERDRLNQGIAILQNEARGRANRGHVNADVRRRISLAQKRRWSVRKTGAKKKAKSAA